MIPGLAAAISGSVDLTFRFRDIYTDDTSLTTYSFANCEFGHGSSIRVVVIAVACGAGAGRTVSSATIGGVSATLATTTTSGTQNFEIWYAVVPTGSTGTVAVTWDGACTSCMCYVWSGYPASSTPVDAVGTTGPSASSLTLSNLAKTAGGFAVFAGRSANASTVTFSSNGAETITEDSDTTALDSAVGVHAGSFVVTATTTTDDMTATYSVGGDGAGFVGATWA